MNIIKTISYEINKILEINKDDSNWHLAFFTGFCMSAPLLVGAFLNNMHLAVISSMGTMLFLYTPKTPLYHRMIVLMACGFGFIVSFIFGGLAHFSPHISPIVLCVLTIIVTMTVRFYQLSNPGNFFFIMIATISIFLPFKTSQLIEISGYFVLGTIWAVIVAFIYSLLTAKILKIEEIKKIKYDGFDNVVVDSVIIGFFVGFSILIAQIIGIERAYWVPISTLAILQGMTLRSKWTRQIHRILGTAIGIALVYFLLRLNLNSLQIAILIGVLGFLAQLTITKHYGLATIFITPMTVYMAEMSGVISGGATTLIVARLEDIILGSIIGFIGGICLHNLKFRKIIIKTIYFFINLLPSSKQDRAA